MAVSPGPGDGGDLRGFGETEEGALGWGLKPHAVRLTEDGGGWGKGAWFPGGGVAWGRDWLGLQVEVWGGGSGSWAVDGGRLAGGVASGRGARVPGGVTGGKETEVSRRVRLPSGDCGVLSSRDARTPFWY